MDLLIPDQRVLRARAATLEVVFTDQNGEPHDVTGPVTIKVVAADGTVIRPAGTATTVGTVGDGIYTLALSPTDTARLDMLTATWTDAASGAVMTTLVEVLGGYYFTVAEARAFDDTLAKSAKFPDAKVIAKRREVEDEAEWICDRSFVPRYRRAIVDGDGTDAISLPDADLRAVRAISMARELSTTFVAFTSTQLAALELGDEGTLRRLDGNEFLQGQSNVIVDYEYGLTRPPERVKTGALLRLRDLLTQPNSGIPSRAVSMTTRDGQTFRLGQPTVFRTGNPEVDAAYGRFSLRTQDDVPQGPPPASRSLDLDPSRWQLFHGGRR